MKRKNVWYRMLAIWLLGVLLVTNLPVPVRANTGPKNPTGADAYYNARTNTDCMIGEKDLFTTIKKVARNTPVHLTGSVIEKYGETGVDDRGDPTYGIKYFVEVELQDGTIGWTNKIYIDEQPAVLTMYLKKDTYLLSGPDSNEKSNTVAYEGEKVTVVTIDGTYSHIRNDKKDGWILSSSLVKLEPKYLYCKKKSHYYYNEYLFEEDNSGAASLGERGVLAVGTKVEYITTVKREGLEDRVYLIVTPTGEWSYVDARDFTFQLPTTVYTESDAKLYGRASTKGKVLSALKMGTKATRLFTQGNFYQVEVNGKTGWISKGKLSTQKVVPVKKNYGTYYLNQIQWNNNNTYPAGTKVIQIDPLFYTFNDKEEKSKTYKKPYELIFAQLPDGRVSPYYVSKDGVVKEGDVSKRKKQAQVRQKEMTLHAKKQEKKIFKEFNAYRKKQGLKALKWDDTAYRYADAYFNYCVMIGDTHFPHAQNSHGWIGYFDDIIFCINAADLSDTAETSQYALDAWKKSPMHEQMMLSKDYAGAAVAVMFNNSVQRMEVVIMCAKGKTPIPFKPEYDTYMAKTWYPFVFKNPKFTEKRGDEYVGDTY